MKSLLLLGYDQWYDAVGIYESMIERFYERIGPGREPLVSANPIWMAGGTVIRSTKFFKRLMPLDPQKKDQERLASLIPVSLCIYF